MKPLFPLIFLLFVSSFLNSCESQITEEDDGKPPNVLLVLTDDQGFGDLGIHQNAAIETPTLDQLATSSVRLNRFYVSPVCAPTRASLLTGRYHLRTGTFWVTRNAEAMRSEEYTLAEMFKDNGYATGIFGKWHNGAHYPQNPNGQGFDEFIGFTAGHWNNYFDSPLLKNSEEFKSTGYISDVFTDHALDFMERNKDEPFFCYVPYNTPHSPYQVADEYYDKYKAMGLDDDLACVYGMVENIDDNMGRMLEWLDESDLAENTIVIFITDNGPQFDRFNLAMKGRKGKVNDGGVRVPFFIKWGEKWGSGKVVNEMSSHIDVLPTLAELCGLQLPENLHLDGINLSGLINGTSSNLGPRDLFSFQGDPNEGPFQGAIRDGQYRWTALNEKEKELTLMSDTVEGTNLISQLPEVASEMESKYLNWFEDVTSGDASIMPIEIGHAPAPNVWLPAHESFLSGSATYKFSKFGWANDWVIDWANENDSILWNLNCVSAGDYRVSMKYTLQENVPCKVELINGDQINEVEIADSFSPKIIDSPDRFARVVEAYDQSWGKADLGVISLKEGENSLLLRSANPPDEMKGLMLERIK